MHFLVGADDQDEALSLADRIVVLKDGVIRQVGTPHELYESPADRDVAEFMGYRNQMPGVCSECENGRASIKADNFVMSGIARGDLSAGDAAVAIFRPDDLTVSAGQEGGSGATVEAVEYRGREYVGMARTPGGLALHFRADKPVIVGDAVLLSADPARVLIFPASGDR